MRFALNATHSTLDVKNSLLLMVVLIALTKNTVLSNNRFYRQARIASCLFFMSINRKKGERIAYVHNEAKRMA
ncbi:hypothetical protein D2M30_3888 [Bacillus amyloliquefaciens]|nr:hypothetical protein D2M30_3888 [Bacillus amyloliquefaciens]